jgi:hypothetical protein
VDERRCPTCRKLLFDDVALDKHRRACAGAHLPDIGDPAIALPAGLGVYCWACGRNRLTVWLEPDFCCGTCKAVLLSAGPVNEVS